MELSMEEDGVRSTEYRVHTERFLDRRSTCPVSRVNCSYVVGNYEPILS